ncbi:hypothetical protein [Saccharicrinis aurantiacus]|uniref:hypothetical protein n=1 Tax=Saccharicrinis aurantiacus TaxID=1849719 RepID=UPI002491CF8E|nr:hypothetical protein [Saccharicrinis aurantiacus]
MKSVTSIICILFCSIALLAQQSTINGYWQLSKVEVGERIYSDLSAIYGFVEDGKLVASRSLNEETYTVGEWEKNKNELLLRSSSLDNDFNGSATIIDLTTEDLVYEKDEAILYFTKVELPNLEPVKEGHHTTIEHLDFTIDDFFDEDEEFKYYDDEEKLPWNNTFELLQYLSKVNELVYHYLKIDSDGIITDNKTLKSKVITNLEEPSLSVDFIFHGYDAYNLPKDTQLPPNMSYDHLLFPEKEYSFRIAGSEIITTPAGEFDCTVLEVIGEFDEIRKLWMITDKPGVYAKIIVYKSGDWGYNALYELQAIN